MTHADVRAHLSEYLEGELPMRQRAILDSHLDTCPPCRDALADLRSAVRLLHGLGETEEPRGRIADAVMQRLRAGEAQPSWWSRFVDLLELLAQPRVVRPAALAAIGAALLVATRPEPLDWVATWFGLGAEAQSEAITAASAPPRSPRPPGNDPGLGAGSADRPEALVTWPRRFGAPRSIEIHRNYADRHMGQVIGSTVVAPTFQPSPSFRSLGPAEPFGSPYPPRVVEVTPTSMQR